LNDRYSVFGLCGAFEMQIQHSLKYRVKIKNSLPKNH
jgi:hypothetical protein